MPQFKEYEDFTRPLPVPLCNGDTLTIRYSPAKYSAGLSKATMPTDSNQVAIPDEQFLHKVLAGWDWMDEKGKEIPITPEFLTEKVNIADRATMVRSIFLDIFPNDGTVTNSSSVSASPGTDGDSGLS